MNKREQALNEWNNLKAKFEEFKANHNLIRGADCEIAQLIREKKDYYETLIRSNPEDRWATLRVEWVKNVRFCQAVMEI